MAKTEKRQFKDDFLEAVINLYKEIGEPVPYGIIAEIKYKRKVIDSGLQELIEDRKLIVIENPFDTNEDFIGLYGKIYPKSMEELKALRENIKTMGVTEARKLLI